MKKLTKEDRAALQSVRAKMRKALAVNAPLTKPMQAHIESVIAFVDSRLAAKAKPAVEAEVEAEAIAAQYVTETVPACMLGLSGADVTGIADEEIDMLIEGLTPQDVANCVFIALFLAVCVGNMLWHAGRDQ